MLVAVCADKGSPGVTTAALCLAAGWPMRAGVVIETDPAGGDLAIRLRPGGMALPEAPTVLTAATAARSNRDPDMLSRYSHPLNTRILVVPGAILAEQMSSVTDWEALAEALTRAPYPVFADLGHLHSESAVAGIAARADVVVVVAGSETTSVIRLRERLGRLATELGPLRGGPPRLFPLLVTTSRHGAAEVADLRGILAQSPANPFLVGAGFLALDSAAVRRLEAGEEPAGRLARTDLLRTARSAARQIAQCVVTTPPTRVSTTSSGGAR
jgi:hypothetical protein